MILGSGSQAQCASESPGKLVKMKISASPPQRNRSSRKKNLVLWLSYLPANFNKCFPHPDPSDSDGLWDTLRSRCHSPLGTSDLPHSALLFFSLHFLICFIIYYSDCLGLLHIHTPVKMKSPDGGNICLFCSLMYPKQPEQGLAHRRPLVNTC